MANKIPGKILKLGIRGKCQVIAAQASILFIFTILLMLNIHRVSAQSQNVGIGTNSPDNSAVLDLSIDLLTNPRGFLAPRMTTAERGNIPAPIATGLLIYNRTDNRYQYYDGSSWVDIFSTGISLPFNRISTGTNTTANMLVGDGASLSTTGTGVIQSNRFVGTGSTTTAVDLATGEVSGVLPVNNGGTNISTNPSNGQLLIGNGTGYTLATLTGGSNISITNAAGSITISSSVPTLNNANIWVGDAGNNPVSRSVTGDLTLTNTGVMTINNNAVKGNHIDLTGNVNGDLMYYNGTDWVRLGVGTANQVLIVSAGLPAWSTLVNVPTGTSGQTLRYDASNNLVANSIIYNDGTNVGIGTSSPSYKLEVNGTLRSGRDGQAGQFRLYSEQGAQDWEVVFNPSTSMTQNTIYTLPPNDGGPNDVLTTDGNGVLRWAAAGGSGSLPGGTSGQTLRHDGTDWIATSFFYNNGTNIGIGTGTPGYVLDVNGAIRSGMDNQDGQIRIYSEQGATDYEVVFNPHAAMTQNTIYTLPANDGTPNDVLTTDGNGNLRWAAGGGSGSLPGGTAGQTLRHDGTEWIANDNIQDDGTNVSIGTTPSGNDKLTVQGNISLDEMATEPTNTSGYGKIYVKGDDSQLWFQDGNGEKTQLSYDCAVFQDSVNSGTGGGTYTPANQWQKRRLNNVQFQRGNSISLNTSTSEITLNTGTYRIHASSPGYRINKHKIRLRQTSGTAATVLYGTTAYALGSTTVDNPMDRSILDGIITVTNDNTVFEIQHRANLAYNSTNALGFPAAFGEPEIYTVVYIQKIH